MMVLEEVGMSVERLREVRDRSLEEAYEDHDVGYEMLVTRLESHGFHVEDHGDDARHADEVLYGDGPDLAVYRDFDEHEQEPVDLLAYIEIKVKTAEEWFGRCNLRHFKEYVNFSNEVDEPVFIWFALVDSESDLLKRDAFFPVEDTDQIDAEIRNVTAEEVVFYEEDIEAVNDQGLVAVDGSDIVGLRTDEQIVDHIPDVHGNEVVCLNEDQMRSFPHFLHVVEQ